MQSRHRRIMELFAEACRRTEPDRTDFLESSCEGDEEILREVRSLLEHDSDTELGTTEFSPVGEASEHPVRIGSYKIERLVGRGGLGAVYQAVQESPERKVAIKILRSDTANPDVVRRFEHEAQILGKLRHPGIAHVYEAKIAEVLTESGSVARQPYLAMELIDGRPLDVYAREENLDVRERLELMARVGDAVEHAHRSFVIHRDLKPENILVEADGQPRILDFGIARVTNSDVDTATLATSLGQVLGTVAYMSPEQASGDPTLLDIRADVYSMGVLLHELLADRLPYNFDNIPIFEAIRIVREEEPTRLGSIHRELRGEIETIVIKALEKDKNRRYGSAADLVADIRRYLNDEPILARPPSTIYQLRKFARRNRALVSGLVVAFVALVVGVIVSLSLFVRSENLRQIAEDAGKAEKEQRLRVEREAKKTEAINDFVLNKILRSPDPWREMGRGVRIVDVLADAAAQVDETFGDEPELAAEVRGTLGRSLLALGRSAEALEQFELALALHEQLPPLSEEGLAAEVHEAAVRDRKLDRITRLQGKASALVELGRYREADSLGRDVLASLREIHGDEHLAVAQAYLDLGRALTNAARYEEALPNLERSRNLRIALLGEDDPAVAEAYSELAIYHYKVGDFPTAERATRKALAIRTKVYGEDSPYIGKTLNELGAILEKLGDTKQAEELHRAALENHTASLGEQHSASILALSNLGNVLRTQSRFEESETYLRRAYDLAITHLGEDHPDSTTVMNSLAYTLHIGTKKIDEAHDIYEQAIESAARNFGPYHPDTIRPTANLAWLERHRGNHEESIRLFRKALAGFETTYPPGNRETYVVRSNFSTYLLQQEKYEEAATILPHVVKYNREKLPESGGDYSWSLSLYGTALLGSGRPAEAEPILAEAVSICREIMPDDWQLADLESKWGESLAKTGRDEEAEKLLTESADKLARHRRSQRSEYRKARERAAEFLEKKGDEEKAAEYRE